MNKIHCLIAVFIVFVNYFSIAQFSGRILDSDQQPIQDVVILNLRTLGHIHSDAFGKFFDPDAKVDDQYQFSYLGYKTDTIQFDPANKEKLTVILESVFVQLNQVDVSEPLNNNLQKIDLNFNPVQNTQELMRKVPGLFIAQHAGGGKAEQMFLRGFDIDHGTDVNIMVDQLLPVNMVSHAHGQGYADLHFVIPETVQSTNFQKGSYNASKGNFATAGFVDFKLKERIGQNSIIFETGKFQLNRIATLLKLINNQRSSSYLAAEYLTSDGYFESPQDFVKLNGLLKYQYQVNEKCGLKFTATHFDTKWNASGQIPTREVESGRLGRFGAIDPTEGGQTARKNFMLEYYYAGRAHENFKIAAFVSDYNFELYSNFTFFLNDSVNGDQIKQKEKRKILGGEATYQNKFAGLDYSFSLGNRTDLVLGSELSHTKNRSELLERKSFGNLTETDFYGVVKIYWTKAKWELNVQSRFDLFSIEYEDLLRLSNYKSSHSEFKASPKFNLNYNVSTDLQIYFNSGLGFHSNDTRLINQNQDPNVLTQSTNLDLGIQLRPFDNLLFHLGVWYIDLEDELVYVGDEAIVESSGHTKRTGLEAGFRSQLWKYIGLDADVSYTIAKTIDDPEGENFIPLAAKWCSSGGISLLNFKQLSGGVRYRYLGDRPANEDYSLTAIGYTLLDANISYSFRNLQFGIIAENLLNSKWNEAQFATESRLKNELVSVEEIHFTPGTPFNIRFKVEAKF
ncbi:MAG: TonB-dependent receptor plug domain-containing protein [Saprospiraceae bacterium]|nr:TonB-dependent receptor plug domain-containing protein [Saprospiraceae bacterium]